MLISIILDNFNYSKFLSQAIESVLSQTYGNFELIIVDDGSTDNSKQIIEKYANIDKRIIPVFKTNGGQASAFNTGWKHVKGEIICFLDADDYFAPNKLEEIVKKHKKGYTYIHTDHQAVDEKGNIINDSLKRFKYNGYCLFLVYYISKYSGNITSTISLKREIAEKIFPLIDEKQWKIQADDLIVFQASMLTRSTFLPKKLTFYRIHSNNWHYGKQKTSDYFYELLKNRNRIKHYFLKKDFIVETFLNNGYNLWAEFKTHKIIDKNLVRMYLKVLWFEMNLAFLKKMEISFKILKTFIVGDK